MDFAAIFGIIGALLSIMHLLPELVLALRTRHLNDLSWGMLIISELNFLSWLMYGILQPAPPITFGAGINTIVIALLIILKYHYKHPRLKTSIQFAKIQQKKRRQTRKARV